MKWEIGSATLPVPQMLSLLMTAPQMGKLTNLEKQERKHDKILLTNSII